VSATDLSAPFRRPLALLLIAAAAQTAGAAEPTTPVITDADLERVRRTQPTVTEQDIEQARRKYHMPGDTELQAAPAAPRIDALPQPAASTPVDLAALARGYAAQAGAMDAAQDLVNGPGLLVFISLSMPQPTLQRLVDQAARARAAVLLRGLAGGSLRQTVAQVQALIGSRNVAVQIDPQAFDRFAIARVPSFVLVHDGTRPASCATGTCAPPEAFLRAAGDVSLDYALEHMQRTDPAFGSDAAVFLARLRS
jgi:conjugal transfer pilus assembly protein TrbC